MAHEPIEVVPRSTPVESRMVPGNGHGQGALEPKTFYRKMEGLLERVPSGLAPTPFADHLAPLLFEELATLLECTAVLVYESHPAGWSLRHAYGESIDGVGEQVLKLSTAPDVGFPRLVDRLGLISIGGVVLALRFAQSESQGSAHSRLMFLSALQYAATQSFRRRELEDQMDQARTIQTNLLPATPPQFFDFDIAARSVPAQLVGGDALDFLRLGTDTLGFAVMDAAGHGLPAALQARDVVTGIRMGFERDLRLARLVERLNRVIHRSGLSSRFVSLVIGELEENGAISYVNAGHPPPLLLGGGIVHELTVGGTVLGPWPESRYRLGFAHLDRGGALLLYTDGVVEHGTTRGEAFGAARLRHWIDDWSSGPASAAIEDLFLRLGSVGGPEPFEDDLSVVLIRRPA